MTDFDDDDLKRIAPPTSPFGPYKDPVDAFSHLPPYTRKFLERLTEEDIKALADIIRSYQRASIIGWFLKWLVVGMAAVFAAAVTFGEGIRKVYGWFLGP